MSTSTVVLLDLREGAPPPLEVAGGVVVVDHAGSLVDHAEIYLSLLDGDMVTSVVCVAVGEAGADHRLDGVVLSLPPALRYATVLWVGDTAGVDWAPDRSGPRPAERPGDALGHLISALLVPTLFDQVVATAEALPSAVLNPGIRLVSSTSDAVELAEARAAAVESLCANGHEAPDLGTAVRRAYLPGSRDGAVLSGPVRQVRVEALQRLDVVAELAGKLGTLPALFEADRPGKKLGVQLAWAGQACENHRRMIAELLNRMDGSVQVGRPSIEDVVELGVPHPREVDGGQIADDLRHAVDTRLAAGDALGTVARTLRIVATNESPQGCTAAIDEVDRRGPVKLEMPAFRSWPLSLLTLPLIFLTCGLSVLLCGPGVPGWSFGAALGLAWFAGGWLLLARRPGAEGETGLRAALSPALLTYGIAALAGVGAGVLAGQLFAVRLALVLLDVPAWLPVVVIAAFLLTWGTTVVRSWSAAVRAWQEELRTEAVRATVSDLTRIAEDVTAREWLPVLRRRGLAAAATQVARGLDEIAGALRDKGDQLFVDEHPPNGDVKLIRPVPQELYAVIRHDLLDVCRDALHPAWLATGSPRDGMYAQRLDRLLTEYGADIRREGLLTASRFSSDRGPRDALMSRVWTESPAALAALRTTAGGDMTQLCRGGQLRYLSTAADPGLVRFAPRRLREVLDREGVHKGLLADPGVVWSDGGELVGALRLLPLRPESVRHVVKGAP
jgi:hypothetical protein